MVRRTSCCTATRAPTWRIQRSFAPISRSTPFAVFMLLLVILGSLAWPKISAALLEREKRIEDNIAAAEAKHEEAKRLLAQYEARLATAAAEVRALLEEARRDAEGTKEQIVAEARAAAQAERDRAVRDIDLAADHAMKDIAETSAKLAVELAGKVIRETINPAKQQELVRSALEKLKASAVTNN
jgi:F-type H+-transporting ATPase subunit b